MKLRALALVVVALGCTEHAPLEVAKVELERFQGGWYEIAKLPRPTQEGCVATTAYYRLKSSTELDVYSECHEGSVDGPVRRMAARAVVTDPDEPAKLSLDFGGFFGDYWIVDRDDAYEHAVVGHPSRDYLWILARRAAISDEDYRALVEHAKAKDFDVSRLEMTAQPDVADAQLPDPSSLPPPTAHGCALGPGRGEGARGFGWLGGAMLALLWVLARQRRRRASRRLADANSS